MGVIPCPPRTCPTPDVPHTPPARTHTHCARMHPVTRLISPCSPSTGVHTCHPARKLTLQASSYHAPFPRQETPPTPPTRTLSPPPGSRNVRGSWQQELRKLECASLGSQLNSWRSGPGMRPREDDTGRDKTWHKHCWLDTFVSFRPSLRPLGWLQQPTSFLLSPAPHPPKQRCPT